MLIRIGLVWSLERAAELFAGAVLALIIFGRSSSPMGATLLGELKLNLIGFSFFYVASGYIVSCIAFGLLSPRRRPWVHGASMAAIFLAHAAIFFLFTTGGFAFPILALVAGAGVVAFVNTAGTAVLKASGRRSAT
jgi:hypothetical protein